MCRPLSMAFIKSSWIRYCGSTVWCLGHTELTNFLSGSEEVFPMVYEAPLSLYIINVILSNIGNKRLGNPFPFSVSEQCGHFCIFLSNPYFSEDFSTWKENRSVQGVTKTNGTFTLYGTRTGISTGVMISQCPFWEGLRKRGGVGGGGLWKPYTDSRTENNELLYFKRSCTHCQDLEWDETHCFLLLPVPFLLDLDPPYLSYPPPAVRRCNKHGQCKRSS